MTTVWIDATAGIAGDMLLGALIDAGAPISGIQAALDAVLPGGLRVETERVTRGAITCTHARMIQLPGDETERTWPAIRHLLHQADIHELTRSRALAVFERLAHAEAHVHGTSVDTVHFHEVGGRDAIGDVVGVCEALRLLGIGADDTVLGSWVAVGQGRIFAAHGLMPVPAPAVAQLCTGWQVRALPARAERLGAHLHDHDHGHTHSHAHSHAHDQHPAPGQVHPHGDAQSLGHEHLNLHTHSHEQTPDHEHHHSHDHAHLFHEEQAAPTGDPHDIGELATPTGMALLRTLATSCTPLPPLTVRSVGSGAGSKIFPQWANCVRVIIGDDISDNDHRERVETPMSHHRSDVTSASFKEHSPDPHPLNDPDPTSLRLVESDPTPRSLVELAANIDDIDHRLVPAVISDCLKLAAVDAWATPIIMKKGRPALTLHALVPREHSAQVASYLLSSTPTLGVREHEVERTIAHRSFTTVEVEGHPVTVKIASQGGQILHAQAEFSSLEHLVSHTGMSLLDASQRAMAAIVHAGLTAGEPTPLT